MPERLIVIGGDAGGMSAASQARRLRAAADLEIVAFERGHFTSYSACGIPYLISELVPDHDELIARHPQTFREKYRIDVRLRHEVVAIDLARREVVARDLAAGGREVRERFDQLVYATGAVPRRPDWVCDHTAGVFGVQTLDDGCALRAWLDGDPRPTRAVVAGGGYIGAEMAEALLERGLHVTLLEQGCEPLATVDADMGARVRHAMVDRGIDVRTGVRVTGLRTAAGRVRALVTDTGEFPTDLVVLGIGTRPNTDLAAASGLPLGPTGGVRVDPRMQVIGVDRVWAAGDCVESVHRVTGRPVHMALGTHANKQGRVAGTNIGGGHATFPGVIGTAVTRVCDLEVARTGLRERDARDAGHDFVSVVAESTNQAGYLPGAETMAVKLIVERGTGRLLGGQIVGRSHAAKRIDTLAVALWNGMTVDEMINLDLGYAPPYSPVWDPVLVAVRAAVRKLHGGGA